MEDSNHSEASNPLSRFLDAQDATHTTPYVADSNSFDDGSTLYAIELASHRFKVTKSSDGVVRVITTGFAPRYAEAVSETIKEFLARSETVTMSASKHKM